ncbi:MAG: hypothetical protein IJ299_05460, partial [Oscillospiraceae bacterium]|nr:hypothetical protein [Oscillospiraceae bacterium]
MAIVRMKRLSVMAMAEDRKKLLELLTHIGVVEISEAPEKGAFSREESVEASNLRDSLATIKSAVVLAKRYGGFKKGLFTPRPEMREEEFMDDTLITGALSEANAILEKEHALSRNRAEVARLRALSITYEPWKELDAALDTPSGRFYDTTLFTVPSAKSEEDISQAAAEASNLSEIFVVSRDRELNYVFVVTYRDDTERVRDAIKQIGGAIVRFTGVNITAKEKISEIEVEAAELENLIKSAEVSLSVTEETFDRLLAAQDALETKISVAQASEMGVKTQRVFYIEGWCPAREEKMLSAILEENKTAYEFRDPT